MTPIQQLNEKLKQKISLIPDDCTFYEKGLYDAYVNCLKLVVDLAKEEQIQRQEDFNKGARMFLRENEPVNRKNI